MRTTNVTPLPPGRRVAIVGLAAGVCAALQMAAGAFPGVGHVLSMFTTLPIALLTMASPRAGLACLAVAAAAVFTVFPTESPILVFMTGSLGFALGLAHSARVAATTQAAAGAVTLTLGMTALSHIIGIDPMGSSLASLGTLRAAGVYLVFSVLYSVLWTAALNRIAPRLLRTLNKSW